MASFVRTETSLPTGSSYVLVVTTGGGGAVGAGGACGAAGSGAFPAAAFGGAGSRDAGLAAVAGRASPYSTDLTCAMGILRSIPSSPATTMSVCELATIAPGT